MKFFIDLALIALFFVTYKLYDIYTAVGVTMIGYFLQFTIHTFYHRKIDKMQLAMLGFVLVLGSATLLFRNELFFKWKPTVIYIIFAVVFYATEKMGNTSLIQRLGGNAITMPDAAWKKLNLSWIIFFILLAVVNLIVAYSFSTDVWVNFKLFGLLGVTIAFILGQGIFISKHMEKTP
jgi:intracellular septation protein